AVTTLQDPVLGLNLARFVDYPHFGALGLCLATGVSVQQLLHRMVRYHGLISDVVTLHLCLQPQYLILRFDRAGRYVPHPQALLFAQAGIVRLLRSRVLGGLEPALIQVPEALTAEQETLQHFFRCPVQSVALPHAAAVWLQRTDETRLLDGGDAELGDLIELTLRQRLKQSVQNHFILELGKWITERLPAGEPTLADAAARFQMGIRTLQRKLKEDGVTWLQLVENARRELVERYRHVEGVSVTQLAFMAGYQDVSSFSRAFKRWYGVAPTRGGLVSAVAFREALT
ncbi:MAG TPA: helix-turn-helix domain-containing protein, partial [Dongiaceae bacterium]|nr:helix-turn-helix domain-containing protein [Dongiaceae bacterium]